MRHGLQVRPSQSRKCRHESQGQKPLEQSGSACVEGRLMAVRLPGGCWLRTAKVLCVKRRIDTGQGSEAKRGQRLCHAANLSTSHKPIRRCASNRAPTCE